MNRQELCHSFAIEMGKEAERRGITPEEFGCVLAYLLASLCVTDYPDVESAAIDVGQWFPEIFAKSFDALKGTRAEPSPPLQ